MNVSVLAFWRGPLETVFFLFWSRQINTNNKWHSPLLQSCTVCFGESCSNGSRQRVTFKQKFNFFMKMTLYISSDSKIWCANTEQFWFEFYLEVHKVRSVGFSFAFVKSKKLRSKAQQLERQIPAASQSISKKQKFVAFWSANCNVFFSRTWNFNKCRSSELVAR